MIEQEEQTLPSEPSASNQDPTLFSAYFGGPRDGLKTGDYPASFSGKKLTGMVSKTPLTQPHELSLYAVYKCTSDAQVNGFWEFHYQGLEGPNGETVGAASVDLVEEWENTPVEPEGTQTSGVTILPSPPATWESKVRGLMLGLALGDAREAEVTSPTTSLSAGAATHLAAWTAEGLLRGATRRDGMNVSEGSAPWTDGIRVAYQRWAALRGIQPAGHESWLPTEDDTHGGWLNDVPIMAAHHGHSPSMEKAVASGLRSGHNSCRPMIKGLPIAVLAGAERSARPSIREAVELARLVAEITHSKAEVLATSALAVQIAIRCLREQESFERVISDVIADGVEPEFAQAMTSAVQLARETPARIDRLALLAPNDTSVSVLAGSVYAALSFPGPDSAEAALKFARRAPDGDGVAAVTGAFIGALYGFEIFPTERVSRLELGWVMDRLALEMALEQKGKHLCSDPGAPREDPGAAIDSCGSCDAKQLIDCTCPPENLGPLIDGLMRALNVSEAAPEPQVKVIKTWRSVQVSPDVLFLIEFEDGTAARTAPICALEPANGRFAGQRVELMYNTLGEITVLRAPLRT